MNFTSGSYRTICSIFKMTRNFEIGIRKLFDKNFKILESCFFYNFSVWFLHKKKAERGVFKKMGSNDFVLVLVVSLFRKFAFWWLFFLLWKKVKSLKQINQFEWLLRLLLLFGVLHSNLKSGQIKIKAINVWKLFLWNFQKETKILYIESCQNWKKKCEK